MGHTQDHRDGECVRYDRPSPLEALLQGGGPLALGPSPLFEIKPGAWLALLGLASIKAYDEHGEGVVLATWQLGGRDSWGFDTPAEAHAAVARVVEACRPAVFSP